MIQMLSHLLITMSPRGDVEISLYFVPIQTPVYPTRIRLMTPADSRRSREFPLRVAQFSQDVADVRVFLDLLRHGAAFQLVDAFSSIDPVFSPRTILLQHVPGQNAITAGVLDVDMEVGTIHLDDNVQIDLQVVGDALLHGEEVCFLPGVPSSEFCNGKNRGDGN